MKLATICIFFLLTGITLYGQNNSSYVSLRGGVSLPIGNYSSTDLEKGSFTTTGFNVSVDGAWYFKPYLGVGGQFGLNFHPIDVRTLGWEKVLDDPFLQDVTIRSEPFQIMTGAIGLYSRWNFWKVLSLHGKVLGGVMWAKTPYQLYKPEYFLFGPEYFEITSARDKNLMILAGLGMQVDVSPCIAFRAEGEYQYSTMAFGFRAAGGTRYDYRDISFINITLALVIIL